MSSGDPGDYPPSERQQIAALREKNAQLDEHATEGWAHAHKWMAEANALRAQASQLTADLEVANAKLSGVHSAVMEYLPPDGNEAKQCISRILAVIDNAAG